MALQLGFSALAPASRSASRAEELASYENRLAGVETKLVRLDGKVNLLTWMVGGLYGVLVVLGAPALWLLLRVASKVGALG